MKTGNSNCGRVGLAAFIFATAGLVGPALAGDEPSRGAEPWSFALDISGADTAGGAERVYRDIRRQASRLCRHHARPPSDERRAERACRASVEDEAVRRTVSRLVAALHYQEFASE